ncbi:MAG: putative signal transducing protein [Anaerovoracaceae bacterium]|jgi:hypothetical protein
MEKKKEWREGIYLCTASNSLEADILISKLEAEGIPSLKKYKGAANFMEIALGSNTTQAIELYVPEETLERAKEVIVPVPIEDDFEEA